ncbi:MAG: hypothetical protein ACYDCO_06520 [Armatimonadota bacterium]
MHFSPMNGVLPPFTLPSNMVYFFDWRYIDHGYLRWLTPEDQSVAIMPAPSPLPPMHGDSTWLPKGVRIETIPARVDEEPVLRAADLGEAVFFGGSVIRDGGVYRMFYESIPPAAMRPENRHQMGHLKVLRLAESDDGYTWRPPELGLVDIEGSTRNNVVFDPGPVGYHGGSVFLDPYGPAEERYKSVWLGYVMEEELRRYLDRWPDDVDPMALFGPDHRHREAGRVAWGIRGAVSPDGLRWTLLEDPLLIQHSDTIQACAYNPLLRRYVLYPRTWFYGRRSVGRAESADFRHFTGLQQLLWPDAAMRATDTWYTPGYATMPGAPDYQLLFATLWSQVDDTFLPILHSSTDSILWHRVPGQPMINYGPSGSWYACGGAVGSELVELPGDRVGCLLGGWHVPHKHPRAVPGFGQCGWATWQRGRLSALRADEDAVFTLYPMRFTGRKMILNCKTKAAGSIQVGVVGTDWYRTIEDCDRITGDHLDRVVTWGGESDLRHTDGESLQLCFRMRAADLYSVRFE